MAAFRIIRRLRDLLDFTLGSPSDGDRVTYDAATGGFVLATPASEGATPAADYLVGTSQAGLSAEIVVGTSPGGELGGTWASPTVDASHSGSTHAAVQAAAEATAAAALSSALAGVQPLDADLTAVAALTTTAFGRGLLALANQAALLSSAGAAAASHAHSGADITSGTVVDARIDAAIARDSEVTSAIAALSSVYQPLDSDLTAVAALTTTSYGRALLALADLAALYTVLGVDTDGTLAANSDVKLASQKATKTAIATAVAGGVVILPAASTRNVIQPTGAAIVPLVIKGFAAQSADFLQLQNSGGAALFLVNSNGGMVGSNSAHTLPNLKGNSAGNICFQLEPDSTVTARVFLTGTARVGLMIWGMAGQTGDHQQWLDGTGAVLASVTAAGLHKWSAANAQATVGAAGAASALPATPTKYLKVVDSAGTTLVIPAYAAA